MKRIFALLMFASFGALLTMIILPPIPMYRVYTHQQHTIGQRGVGASKKYRHIDLEREPIIGYPSPQYTATQNERIVEDRIQMERESKS